MQLLNQWMYLLSVWYKTILGEVTDENVYKALQLMGKGMLGIFVVIVIIYLVIVLLNKITADKETEKDQ